MSAGWSKAHPQRQREHMRAFRARNPLSNRADMKRRREELLAETVAAYGGCCACCGEAQVIFLTIDHVFNDGAQHRRKTVGDGRAGVNLYSFLKKEGFPKDRYRLLCFNCNCGRARNGGICPHEEAR